MDGTFLRGQLLGRLRVTVAGEPTVSVWPRPSARRLVMLLLLAPEHVCSRAVIADRLFPQLEPARASRAVSKALSMARSVLDGEADRPSVLAADRTNVWIAEHLRVEVDLLEHLAALEGATVTPAPASRIERLRAALQETRPPLVDDAYEDWAMEVVAEVERSRAAARLLLARTSQAEADWEAVAAADPSNEEACAALVDHRLRAGRPREAARAVEACRTALERLGLPLAPGLAAIAMPEPAAVTREVIWPLFGREAELAATLDAVGPAAAGSGGTMLVAGPSGIGKTHLLRHGLVRLADAGWTVATAASVRDDRLAPFASLRTALLPHLTGPASPLINRILLPEAADVRTRALPPAELAALADAIRRHLDGLAERRPLVLCLDDLHWADQALQTVLARLASGIGPRRWSLLLAARTDEPDAPVPELPTTVFRLSLGPLDPQASSQLAVHAAESAGSAGEGRAREVAARGHGHPFFIVELARSSTATAATGDDHPWSVPARIVELLRQRVARCSLPARRMTALVAIAGEDATIDVITRVSAPMLGHDVELADIVDELERAFLVHDAGGQLRLVHPLLRDAAESTLNPLRRAQLHELIAGALVGDVARVGGAAVLSIARHRLAAFHATRAARYATAAATAGFDGASVAYGLGAAAATEELYMGALEAFASVDAREHARLGHQAFAACIGLGRVRLDGGAYPAAEEAFEAAMRLAATVDEHARAWRWLAENVYRQGDFLATIDRLERGLATIPAGASLSRARLLVDVGWCRTRRGEQQVALEVLREAVALAYEADDWCVLTEALDRYAFTLADVGSTDEALELFERAEDAANRCGDHNEQAIVRLHRAVALNRVGRDEEALSELAAAAALCHRYGLLYTRTIVHWVGAEVAEGRGDIEAALAERDAELSLLTDLSNDRHLAKCQAHRAKLLHDLERQIDAEEAGSAAIEASDRVGDPSLTDEVHRMLTLT
jgi:DNA-binding SARP family transcriptional activator/tetratricopeptide (TPR) repeat protein